MAHSAFQRKARRSIVFKLMENSPATKYCCMHTRRQTNWNNTVVAFRTDDYHLCTYNATESTIPNLIGIYGFANLSLTVSM